MAPVILWFLDRLQGLFRMLGADYGQLRAIVRVKLMMDNRRNIVSLGRYGRQSGESNDSFLRILGIYALVGGLLSFAMLGVPEKEQLFLPLTLEFSYVMALCAMTLISDFSSVILDSSDNQIILPRPVSNRTLWLARIVHITSYLFTITLSLTVVGIFILWGRFGSLVALLFLLLSLLSAVFMVFLTNLFYLGLIRFTSEEKLREIINYFQIVMAILFYGGYQILPRVIGSQAIMNQSLAHQWWHYLVPSMWMAGALETFIQPIIDQTHLIFLGLALLTPFAGIWFMNRFLTTDFTQKLSSIDQENRPTEYSGSTQKSPTRSNWMARIADLATSNTLERAAFVLTWHITSRDRKFKLKTYPQLGFGLAYVIAMSFQSQSLGASNFFYLFALYFGGIYIMVVQYQLRASDNFRASWVYGSAPIQEPGSILSGALKAIIIKLLLPFYAVLASYILYRYGIDKISDVLLAFSNSLVMLISSALLSTRYMPFSVELDAIKQNNTARGLLISLVLGIVGFSHYGLTFIPYGIWIAIPVSAGLFLYMLHQYKKTSWQSIEMA